MKPHEIYGKAPCKIGGVHVEPSGDPLLLHGETWLTMVPVDPGDDRIWEYSVTTKRIIRTR